MELKLQAQIRNILGKKVKQLREKGIIPAELYGHNVQNKHIAVEKKEFSKIYKEAGENTIIYLELDGQKIPALVANVEYNYLTGEVQSVDFHQVQMGEKIEVEIPVELKGEAPAVKKGFIIVKTLNEIKVSSDPSSLPHLFEVDISALENLGDKIMIEDLKAPKNVKILASPEIVIAAVVEPAKEEISSTVPSSYETTPPTADNKIDTN